MVPCVAWCTSIILAHAPLPNKIKTSESLFAKNKFVQLPNNGERPALSRCSHHNTIFPPSSITANTNTDTTATNITTTTAASTTTTTLSRPRSHGGL